MNEILTRDKLPENYKWDMTALYADDAAWEQERAAVAATGPANLREAIRLLRSYTAELDAALNPAEQTR